MGISNFDQGMMIKITRTSAVLLLVGLVGCQQAPAPASTQPAAKPAEKQAAPPAAKPAEKPAAPPAAGKPAEAAPAAKAPGQGERLVVGMPQWGVETPLPWRQTLSQTPDKYTVVFGFKNPSWDVASRFSQVKGYQNIVSKKHLESVGEERAARQPIGTGPYKYLDGRQGDTHRFEVRRHGYPLPGLAKSTSRRS